MKLKIISDGTMSGTKVVDEKTGEILEGVRYVKWNADVDCFSIAQIEIISPKIEITLLEAEVSFNEYGIISITGKQPNIN